MDSSIIIAIIGGATTVLAAYITSHNNSVLKKNNKIVKDFFTLPPLRDNKLFVHFMEYQRTVKTMNIEKVEVPGRRSLVRDFVYNSLLAWEEPINEFVEFIESSTKDKGAASNEVRIYSETMKMFEAGISYYTEDYRISYHDEKDSESMNIFRNKYVEWNDDRVQRLKNKLEDICNEDSFYKSTEFKAGRILEAIDDYLYNTIKDGKYSAIRLNGELTGKSYHGRIL